MPQLSRSSRVRGSSRSRWTLRQPDRADVAEVMRAQGVPEPVARLLVNRGHSAGPALEAHLRPDLKQLHDPFLLPDLDKATARISRAIEDGERILVHGDYDVDGVTGTSILVRLFRLLGAEVDWHIPNRFTDGYSFGDHSVKKAREVGATVVISVDNGTSANETIGKLRELGIDTIVTDHHEPPLGELPPAVAIVNPKIASSTYPFRELCGGAVAFKLAWGVCQTITGASRVRADLRDFLIEAMGYVAIATVCDVVPLVEENRVLARFGLRSLENTCAAGLAALLRVAKLSGKRLVSEDVGFQIGPRINASGRLGSAHRAVELMLSTEEGRALELANELGELNEERKRLQRDLTEVAAREAEQFADATRWPVLVVAGEGWHQGIIGIVAARLVELFDRPAIVIGLDGDRGRGSARSVAGFSVLEAMHGGADHMRQYGGHAQAAGCEVLASDVDALREAICDRARTMLGEGGYPEREVLIDGDVTLRDMSPALMQEIDRLEPFGQLNEKPVLLARDARLAEPARVIGVNEDHLLLRVRQGSQVHKALAFGQAHRVEELQMGVPLHLVYTPRWNTFRGETNLELLLEDFATGAEPSF